MKRAILFILLGILMNTVDTIYRGGATNLVLKVTHLFFTEANHQKHILLDDNCRLISEWSESQNISAFIKLHTPFTLGQLIPRLLPCEELFYSNY